MRHYRAVFPACVRDGSALASFTPRPGLLLGLAAAAATQQCLGLLGMMRENLLDRQEGPSRAPIGGGPRSIAPLPGGNSSIQREYWICVYFISDRDT